MQLSPGTKLTIEGRIAQPIFRVVVCVASVLAVVAVVLTISVQDRLLAAALTPFLVLVLMVSIGWGIRYSIFLSLFASLAFSLSLPPAGHFHLSDGRVWTVLAACLVTGLTASYLSDRMRRALLEANQRRAEAITEQQRFRDLVNSVEGIVWEADAETFAFSFVSQQAERILGYPIERWLREATFWKDHLHPEDREWAVRFCQEATLQKRSQDFEYRMIAADGSVVWMRDLVTVAVENERASRLRGVMIDVTRRQRNEEALREQANLLSLTHDAIFARDMTGTIKYWNRSAEMLYGWTAEEAVGKLAQELLKTQFPVPLKYIEEELMLAGRWEGELVHTKKVGTTVVVASRWSLQRDDKCTPLAILETNNDITERKRAEEERERLRELEANLAHLNRVSMMGELAASLGHEIKQPIAAAITNANTCLRWLKRDQPDLEEARQAGSRMVEDVMRSVEIINRTSSLYKKGTPQREVIDINEVINDIVALLRNEADRYSVSIHTELAADLPKVMGDRVQLQQVLMNLMINSIDAMKSVDGTREVALRSQRDDNGELMVSVRDAGVGLPPEIDQIFTAFFTTKPHGTGMGLAVSRAIIESHGGRLSAISNVDRGATFYFTLPVSAGAQA